MSEINYLKNSKKFWENHRQSKENRNKIMKNLSFSEKADITEMLQTDYELLQDAREQFGLGEVSSSETKVSSERTFSQADFNNALNKGFTFTQDLQLTKNHKK